MGKDPLNGNISTLHLTFGGHLNLTFEGRCK